MPTTARKHFEEDIKRAREIAQHSSKRRASLREDLWRWAWVVAIGALDAYLCDAYVDILCAQLRAYNTGQLDSLPAAYARVNLPAGEVLKAGRYTSRGNWALRMAARKVMAEENMLQLSRVPDMFNPALPQGYKLRDGSAIEAFVEASPKRLVGLTASEYRAKMLNGGTQDRKDKVRKSVWNAMVAELGKRIQRRHDIVHNCDRPKEVCLDVTQASVEKTILYVRAFVETLDDHLDQHRTF